MRVPPRTVGLMGGSFNPAHGGHRHIALEALDALRLDEVWWLVSPGNPLKDEAGMAPLPVRYSSALAASRRARIRPTAIERELGTRYTVDTLRKLQNRYPHIRFIWIMGGDNLHQFHRWKDWRGIARRMPIAVIARPGYDEAVHGTSAMAWLRRFVRRTCQSGRWTQWRPPALVLLRFRPDPRSATQLRRANPHWPNHYRHQHLRDVVTRRVFPVKE
ncbi:MAG TPA: nicotinate-nucleotide adenylyltransferase [Sphingobium sp.]|uniref:nicotinate-nucleotide adenylyltransferase n=1 Tax=Sphingobium sp. TaxID=1912891 RepID=UPI002ED4AF82